MCKPQSNWNLVHFCALWCFHYVFLFASRASRVNGRWIGVKKGRGLCVSCHPPYSQKKRSSSKHFQPRVCLSHRFFSILSCRCQHACSPHCILTDTWTPLIPHFKGPATPPPPPPTTFFLLSVIYSSIWKIKGYFKPCNHWRDTTEKRNVTLMDKKTWQLSTIVTTCELQLAPCCICVFSRCICAVGNTLVFQFYSGLT